MLNLVATPANRAQRLLAAAQHKLHATDIPAFLRFTAFLRLTCLSSSEPNAYSNLLQNLAAYPAWWATCSVTAANTLTSTEPAIAALLAPINRWHHPQTLPLAA